MTKKEMIEKFAKKIYELNISIEKLKIKRDEIKDSEKLADKYWLENLKKWIREERRNKQLLFEMASDLGLKPDKIRNRAFEMECEAHSNESV